MDMVLEILQTINSQPESLTMRHIAYRTGIATTTLVGVMMGMLNQGYVIEVLPSSAGGSSVPSRCTCPCCRRKIDAESTTSLDRRLFRNTWKGERYMRNRAEKTVSK